MSPVRPQHCYVVMGRTVEATDQISNFRQEEKQKPGRKQKTESEQRKPEAQSKSRETEEQKS